MDNNFNQVLSDAGWSMDLLQEAIQYTPHRNAYSAADIDIVDLVSPCPSRQSPYPNKIEKRTGLVCSPCHAPESRRSITDLFTT